MKKLKASFQQPSTELSLGFDKNLPSCKNYHMTNAQACISLQEFMHRGCILSIDWSLTALINTI